MAPPKAKRLSTKIAMTFDAELNPLRNQGLAYSIAHKIYHTAGCKARQRTLFSVLYFFSKYVNVPKRVLVLEALKTEFLKTFTFQGSFSLPIDAGQKKKKSPFFCRVLNLLFY